MKQLVVIPILALALFTASSAHACVGRVLYIGVTSGASERMLAEMTSVLINERTGTTVKVQTFKNSTDLYGAMKQGKVSLIIETTDHALEVLHRPKEANQKAAFELVKSEYKKSMNLVWFEQFGGSHRFAPVVTVDTLSNYPALPKLIHKLAGVLNDDNFTRLSRNGDSEERLKKATREFLKSKKLI